MSRRAIQKTVPVFQRNMERLKKKFETARRNIVPNSCVRIRQKVQRSASSPIGSTEAAILEAKHQLETEHGIQADFLRVRALPFTQEVSEFVSKYDQIYVVEMNRDGQMNQMLTIGYPQGHRTSNLLRLVMVCQPPQDGCVKAFCQVHAKCEA